MPLLFLSLALAQTPVVPYTDIGEKPVAPEDVPAAPPPPPVVRKLDCLAGVCLGSSPSSTTPTVVTVADHKWARTLEVCAGKVVGIWINHSWYQTGFTFVGAPPGSTTPVYGEDGTAAGDVLRRVTDAMESKGWAFGSYTNDVSVYRHTEIDGARGTVFQRVGEGANGWTVAVVTLHPERPALCAARDGAGL
jgi:hypothetical protein